MWTPKAITYTVEVPRTCDIADMLRRDHAEPADDLSKLMVARLTDGKDYDRGDVARTVQVNLITHERFGPLVKRWESFGCKVVACDDPTVELTKPPIMTSAGPVRTARVDTGINEGWAYANPALAIDLLFRFIHKYEGDQVTLRVERPGVICLIAVMVDSTEAEQEAAHG